MMMKKLIESLFSHKADLKLIEQNKQSFNIIFLFKINIDAIDPPNKYSKSRREIDY